MTSKYRRREHDMVFSSVIPPMNYLTSINAQVTITFLPGLTSSFASNHGVRISNHSIQEES